MNCHHGATWSFWSDLGRALLERKSGFCYILEEHRQADPGRPALLVKSKQACSIGAFFK